MKKTSILFVGLSLFYFSMVSEAKASFEEAVQQYKQGDYQASVKALEILLEEGDSSANLYYNLGNSYYKSGQLGKSIWAYERAKRLNPRDPDIRSNLELANQHLKDKFKSSFPPWLQTTQNTLGYIQTREISLVLRVCFGLWCLFAFLMAFKPLKPLMAKLVKALLLVSVLAGALMAVRYFEVRYPQGIIQGKEVSVRYGPADSNTKAFVLHEGSKVSIEKESASWYFVRFGERQSGWLPQHAVLKV